MTGGTAAWAPAGASGATAAATATAPATPTVSGGRRAPRLGPGDGCVGVGGCEVGWAMVRAAAAPAGVTVVCIDPHGGNDRGPQQYEGEFAEGQRDHEAFVANLRRTGVIDRIRHIRKASQ